MRYRPRLSRPRGTNTSAGVMSDEDRKYEDDCFVQVKRVMPTVVFKYPPHASFHQPLPIASDKKQISSDVWGGFYPTEVFDFLDSNSHGVIFEMFDECVGKKDSCNHQHIQQPLQQLPQQPSKQQYYEIFLKLFCSDCVLPSRVDISIGSNGVAGVLANMGIVIHGCSEFSHDFVYVDFPKGWYKKKISNERSVVIDQNGNIRLVLSCQKNGDEYVATTHFVTRYVIMLDEESMLHKQAQFCVFDTCENHIVYASGLYDMDTTHENVEGELGSAIDVAFAESQRFLSKFRPCWNDPSLYWK